MDIHLIFSSQKVDDVETKLDNLIELYMQDRKRLLSLPICPEAHSNLPPLPPNPPGGAGSMGILSSSNNNANNGASCSGSIMVKMVS
jgi:hypothetical protein